MSENSKSSQKEAMKLNNFEVYISFIKFYIMFSIFNRPYKYKINGFINCILAEMLTAFFVTLSLRNMVDAMEKMPKETLLPENHPTYGKVVEYLLD
jgi:hypothetical protein